MLYLGDIVRSSYRDMINWEVDTHTGNMREGDLKLPIEPVLRSFEPHFPYKKFL